MLSTCLVTNLKKIRVYMDIRGERGFPQANAYYTNIGPLCVVIILHSSVVFSE